MSDSVFVRVPASSANLGPGFDVLGMALSLYFDMGFDDGAPIPQRAKVLDEHHPATIAFRLGGGHRRSMGAVRNTNGQRAWV